MSGWRLVVAALVLTPAPGFAQAVIPGPPPAQRGLPMVAGERRQELRQQVFVRFMDRASQRLALSAGQRARVEQVLLRSEGERAELARQAREVRRSLVLAGRDSGTPQQEYDRLLQRMTDLRAQELSLWEREQAELGQILNPRQRAQLLAMRLELFERVQRMREQRIRQNSRSRLPR